MFTIHVSTKPCPYCDKAKALLTEKGLPFEVDVLDARAKLLAFQAAGFVTVPQIFRDGVHIGGYEALARHLEDKS